MVPVSLDCPCWSKSVSVLVERTRSPASSPQHVLCRLSQQVSVSGEVLKPQKNCQCGRHGWILHQHLWQWHNKSLSRDWKRLKTMKYSSPRFSLHVPLSTTEEQVASKMNNFYKLWCLWLFLYYWRGVSFTVVNWGATLWPWKWRFSLR